MPQDQLYSYRFGAKWDRNSGKISHESRKALGEAIEPGGTWRYRNRTRTSWIRPFPASLLTRRSWGQSTSARRQCLCRGKQPREKRSNSGLTSGGGLATGLEVRLKVPSLNATEVLQARAITCDGKEAYSQEEVVQPSGELGRSLIEEPLYEGNVA